MLALAAFELTLTLHPLFLPLNSRLAERMGECKEQPELAPTPRVY